MSDKLITNFDNFNEPNVSSVSKSMIEKLTGNASFTFVNKELDNLVAADKDYDEKRGIAVNGSTTDIAIKNAALKVLRTDLSIISKEVNVQANGDETKLLSSGGVLAQDGQHHTLEAPTGFDAKSGANTGDVAVSCKANQYAHGYLFFYTTLPAPASMSDWKQIYSTKHTATIHGLTRGTEYTFCAAYQTTKGDALVYCKPISIFVQ